MNRSHVCQLNWGAFVLLFEYSVQLKHNSDAPFFTAITHIMSFLHILGITLYLSMTAINILLKHEEN
jgi:hypothetical protein